MNIYIVAHKCFLAGWKNEKVFSNIEDAQKYIDSFRYKVERDFRTIFIMKVEGLKNE